MDWSHEQRDDGHAHVLEAGEDALSCAKRLRGDKENTTAKHNASMDGESYAVYYQRKQTCCTPVALFLWKEKVNYMTYKLTSIHNEYGTHSISKSVD